ncbi:GNAT family N-acetyltransferase [Argonema galeatum]|uniref:GNAT family N-acetyltransferase n=1 Tax=Argonema galeatum TaxID=2942762 RepID=UPI00201319DF|nr:GNAT family N-acetyltransferase [Argonema galeatum]MCL1467771.1 GNAT family N-acetyltransferase [Argonema galeatum A003/A1]
MQWIFCSIDDAGVIRDNFDCGIPELNEYLKKYARQNQRKGIAKTWVAITQGGDRQVAGYYSISMAELKQESLPENYRKGLPRYPIPVMRIGKLAVTQSMQGRRLGETLLVDAFNRVIRLSQDIGVFGVIVDALNAQAKEFYLKYSFITLESDELSLFIPITRILEEFT